MKKRIIIGLLGLGLAMAMTGCGSGSKDNGKAVVESKDDVNYQVVFDANKGSELLKKYDSVQYVLNNMSTDEEGETSKTTETWTLYKKDGDCVIDRISTTGEEIIYMDGTCYYEDLSDKEKPAYSQGWFMEDEFADYMNDCVDQFLIDQSSKEEFDSVEKKDDTYVINSLVGSSEEEKYYYRYTVDAKTLEIEKFEAIIATGDDEEVVADGIISTNVKTKEPDFVAKLQKPESERTMTITIDPGKDTERVEKVKISANATMLAALPDGYGLYEDINGITQFDDDFTTPDEKGLYPDMNLYCIQTETASGEAATAE